MLLIPRVVDLDEQRMAALAPALDELATLGLVCEAFGPGAVLVRETPAILGEVDCVRLVADIADLLVEDGDARALSRRLDLSAARAHDAALDILGAYKLTGNFHINLEIVLQDLGVLDKVRHEIERETPLPFHSDCRHVVFRPGAGVHMDSFAEITRSIAGRIGFDPELPWWGRLFH